MSDSIQLWLDPDIHLVREGASPFSGARFGDIEHGARSGDIGSATDQRPRNWLTKIPRTPESRFEMDRGWLRIIRWPLSQYSKRILRSCSDLRSHRYRRALSGARDTQCCSRVVVDPRRAGRAWCAGLPPEGRVPEPRTTKSGRFAWTRVPMISAFSISLRSYRSGYNPL